jgi:hypothetical protein
MIAILLLNIFYTLVFAIANTFTFHFNIKIPLTLKPNRIIFNPGAENQDFARKAKANGADVLNACNLVMLSTGSRQISLKIDPYK